MCFKFSNLYSAKKWLLFAFVGTFLVACGDNGRDSILGTEGNTALSPQVIEVSPTHESINVSVSDPVITAEFNETITPLTATDFTLSCADPCTSPTGTISMNEASTVATFTLTPPETLEDLTLYTATIHTATSATTGLTIESPYVWEFTTGLTADTTRPRVIRTEPLTTSPGPTDNVPVNTSIVAVFSEDMLASTVNGTTFTLNCEIPCTPPVGQVSYSSGARSAVFTPEQNLEVGVTYTATVDLNVTDLTGNQLAVIKHPLRTRVIMSGALRPWRQRLPVTFPCRLPTQLIWECLRFVRTPVSTLVSPSLQVRALTRRPSMT